MKITLNKAVKYAVTAVSFILIACSLSVLVLSGALKFFLTKESFYVDRIVTDKYVDRIYELSDEDIKVACGMYGFDSEALSGCLDKEIIRELSRRYVKSLFASLKDGTKNDEVSYPVRDFANAIELYAQSADDDDLYRIEENRQALSENLAKRVTKKVNSFSDQTLITDTMHKFLFGNRYVNTLTELFFPSLAVFILMTAVMILFGPRPRARFYLASLAMYIGALVCFVPINKIRLYDFMPKLRMVPNASKAFLDAAWDGVILFLYRYALTVLAAVSVLLCASVVFSLLSLFKKSGSGNGSEDDDGRSGDCAEDPKEDGDAEDPKEDCDGDDPKEDAGENLI